MSESFWSAIELFGEIVADTVVDRIPPAPLSSIPILVLVSWLPPDHLDPLSLLEHDLWTNENTLSEKTGFTFRIMLGLSKPQSTKPAKANSQAGFYSTRPKYWLRLELLRPKPWPSGPWL